MEKTFDFWTAFKSYEEGIVIESMVSGDKFKKHEGIGYCLSKGGKVWFVYDEFTADEIRGGWLINK